MKKYSKALMTLAIMCALCISGISHAKVRLIQSRRTFERTVAKESMVVVLFYDDRDKDLTKMYEDISNNQRYDDADVIFLKVNTARKELRELAKLYSVTAMPIFIFFSEGKRLVDSDGIPIVLRGSVSRDIVQSFIDKEYGAEIEHYITKKEARNTRRLAQENESWKVYYYPRDIFVRSYGPDERDLE